MNYIIDCGFSSGVFSLRFLRKRRLAGDDMTNWTVLGFEPDSRWDDRRDVYFRAHPDCKTIISPSAVWTEDGEMKFFPCMHAVSSYLSGAPHRKFESGRKASKIIPTVDLDRVIRELKDPEQIILKMDIEGGEFYVLPHIQASGAAELLTYAYIEYHARLNRRDWLPIMVEIKDWWEAHQVQHRNWR